MHICGRPCSTSTRALFASHAATVPSSCTVSNSISPGVSATVTHSVGRYKGTYSHNRDDRQSIGAFACRREALSNQQSYVEWRRVCPSTRCRSGCTWNKYGCTCVPKMDPFWDRVHPYLFHPDGGNKYRCTLSQRWTYSGTQVCPYLYME